MRSHSFFRAVAALTVVLACGACKSKQKTAQLTQRERDSLIAGSRLPGARGVGGAMKVQDSAARRQAVLDSIARADSR